MKVSIFGLGYVGSVTAACLARAGHEVIGVDVNEEKVRTLNGGTSPVMEPGLGDVVAETVAAGRLRAVTSPSAAVAASDVALLCVGTPSRPSGRLDTDALVDVGRQIGAAVRGRRQPFTVVVRSTVLPGTTARVVVPAIREAAGGSFRTALRVAVNPEFMREGSSLQDFARPPMTLVGTHDAAAVESLRSLYAGVDAPFVHTAPETAEMAKYVANTFHALKVCFANEIADVCDAIGADAQEVMRVFALDRKLSISDAYLRPGFAFGGSCLPKDVRALLGGARSADLLPPLLSAVLPSNEAQIRRGIDAVLASRKRRIGVVGLSFKEGTDDLRESPMVTLVEALIGKGCDVRILDANVSVARLVGANRRYIEEQIPHIASLMCDDVRALVAHAEVLVIGNASPQGVEAARLAGGHQTVVDLTRGTVCARAKDGAAA